MDTNSKKRSKTVKKVSNHKSLNTDLVTKFVSKIFQFFKVISDKHF